MMPWSPNPTIYEINTWVWLAELGRKSALAIDLSCVPAADWDAIAAYGFESVWLMGVWDRSPAGIAVANRNAGLLQDFRRALPDFRPEDNVGSPYCVRNYSVDPQLGGPQGLAIARQELANRGMKLLLDFVPNHVAPDHPWVLLHPEYFLEGTADEARTSPNSYIEVQGKFLACGRDPYFPAWPDVLQLNAFSPGLRGAVTATVSDIARQCDGIRCDMAMLLLNAIFERTWGNRAGRPPTTEYWSDLIPVIKKKHSGFLFIAEAYWDMEYQLQQLGFDFCYDKRLYDRLEHDNAENVRLHLCADVAYQRGLLRFIENHDEPRAATTFPPAKERAAAVTASTSLGARLFHEGQFEGRKVRLPVFLARRPAEPVDKELQTFYRNLLRAIHAPALQEGEWALCERSGWPDNSSFENLIAWSWKKGDEAYLIVVNLSDSPAQALVRVPWEEGAGKRWQLSDELTATVYEREGNEMLSPGLYVDLEAWNVNFFRCVLLTLAE